MVINVQSLRFASQTPPLALTRGTLALGSVCQSCGESLVTFSFSPAAPSEGEPLVRVELRESLPEYVEGIGSLTVVGIEGRETDRASAGEGVLFKGGLPAVDVDIVFDPDVEVLDAGGDAQGRER